MTLSPEGIVIGLLTITWFSIIAAGAVVAGAGLSLWLARRAGLDEVATLAFYRTAGIGALVVGRLFFLLMPPRSAAPLYSGIHLGEILFDLQIGFIAFWSGGIDRGGALLGAALGLAWALFRQNQRIKEWYFPLLSGFLAMAAIMPLANLPARSLLGSPTTLPWGMTSPQRVGAYAIISAFPPETRFHPTPLYVSISVAILAAVTVYLYLKGGLSNVLIETIFAGILVVYFVFDFIRMDIAQVLLGLSPLQVVSLIGVVGLAILRFREYQAGSQRGPLP